MKNYKKRTQDNKLLKIWYSMKSRCLNPNCKDYKNYGAKDRTICVEWLDYETFRIWALENGYEEGLSIDRIDNSKGYNPNNCEWISPRDNVIRMYKYYNGSPLKGTHIKEDTKQKISNSLKLRYEKDPTYKDKIRHSRDENGNTKLSSQQLSDAISRYHNGESKANIYKDYQFMNKNYFYSLIK